MIKVIFLFRYFTIRIAGHDTRHKPLGNTNMKYFLYILKFWKNEDVHTLEEEYFAIKPKTPKQTKGNIWTVSLSAKGLNC